MAAEDLSRLKIEKQSPVAAPGRRKKRLVQLAIAAGVVALVIVLFAGGLFSPRVEVTTATVSQVYPSQAFTLLNASGYVVAQRKAEVAAKITGRLEWLGVEEGNRVKKGQILARLENMDAVAARDQAAANVENARATVEQAKTELEDATLAYRRVSELVSQGIVAKADFDAATARYQKAKAALDGARYMVKSARSALRNAEASVGYSYIRAPFDAVVLTKNADIGDIVTPIGAAASAKAAVVSIADMDSLQVEADVSEANLAKVKVGQPCEIQLDAFPEARFRGVVHMVVPTADRSKATVMVKVRFLDRDSRILPEMSAKVAFLERVVAAEERSPRLALNPAAITERSGRKVVFVVTDDDKIVETPIKPGRKIGDMIEVESGVRAGDKIVLKPLDKLKQGTRIKTAEK